VERLVSIVDELVADLRKQRALSEDQQPIVLLVEDDPADIILVTRVMDAMSVKVDVAKNVDDALGMLYKSKHPDKPDYQIVFLDLKLECGGSGVDVLKKIKDLTPSLPVVVITGSAAYSQEVAEAIKIGYIGLIQKPLDTRNARDIFAKHKIPWSEKAKKIEDPLPEHLPPSCPPQ
jgi:DNA-binding NtrC family response regulator